MEKEIICLMCQDIRNNNIDINQLAIENSEDAIDFIHSEYQIASQQFNKISQSLKQ